MVYANISPKMAMKIAKRSTLDTIKATDWKVFAAETGLTEPYIRQRIRQLADAVDDHIDEASAPFKPPAEYVPTMNRVVEQVRGRAADLRRVC